jgi:hypothetical protein
MPTKDERSIVVVGRYMGVGLWVSCGGGHGRNALGKSLPG